MKAGIETPPQVSLRHVAKRFLIIFLPLVILLGGILAVFCYQQVKNERTIIESEEVQHVSHQMDIIINDLQLIVSDLMFLSEQNELREMLDSGEAGVPQALAEEWLSFFTHKGLYDQIRFLNETGMEVVRVNFNNGNPSIVPDDQLHSKAKRYYFEDTFVLQQGEVYVSPFDLNIENGEIEQPLKPMIRFGTPVFDSYGQKRGIVLLNLLGANLLHDLEETLNGYGQFMLLNSDGFWLMGPTPEDEWGFMYEDKSDRTFGNDFTEAWQRISGGESGQFYNADGMFTYTTVYPLMEGQISRSTGSGRLFEPLSTQRIEANAYFWKTVSRIPSDVLSASTSAILGRLLLPYAVMVVLLAGGSWSVARTGARRKQAEEERRASEDRYRALLNLGAEVGEAIIMMCDTEQGEAMQIFVNDEWPRITGYSKDELLGISFFDIVHPKDRQASIERHRRKMKGETLAGLFEMSIIRKDGTETPIEITSAYSTYKGERADVAYIRDITERRQAERKLKEYRDHLKEMVDKRTAELKTINERLLREITERKGAEEKTEELYKLERKLRRKLEIQKEQRIKFTKTLVHELKTPLTPMRAASELLIAESRENSQLSLAKTINRGVLNLDRRIDELLDLAKGGIGILKLKYRLADPLQLLYEVADYVAPEAAKNGHSLALDLPPSLPTLWCDQDRLRQVVLNLLSNAFKFTPEGGRVTLRAKQKDDTLIVEVQDTGCGISDDKKQQLFKPYDQVEGDQEQFSGLGVGLALCKILVELHGGQIWVESQNGKGSSFIFTIPSKTKGL